MKIIPAIDLLDGKVVRLKKGSYDDVTLYNEEPIKEAIKFRNAGFRHIHIVDLNGAKEGKFVNLQHIQHIKQKTGLSIQTGGGIRSYEDARQLIDARIDQLVCSSLAIKKPGDWLQLLRDYPRKMILGMDLKDGKVAYNGWLETADESIESFLKPMTENGLQHVLCTDIARDGMLQGVNNGLYCSLQEKFPGIKFIASGGVASVEDFKKLQQIKTYAVVVGRAYYENIITLEEMQEHHSSQSEV